MIDFNALHKQPLGQPKLAKSGESLAKNSVFSQKIEIIKSLVALPPKHYDLYYKLPLETLVAIYQHFPAHIIELKLANIINALKLRRPHNLPLGVKPENVREKKDIWTYATFAAALLHKLPDLTNYTVLNKASNSSEYQL